MSRPFSHYSAKSAFSTINECVDSSSYTKKKRLKTTHYPPRLCYPNKNMNSQSNLLFLKETLNSCVTIDKTQLYINLYTELDLSLLDINTSVISDLSGNTFPVIIDTNVTPYLKYNIDPSGALFGNNTCGINNYINYVKYVI
jgi:hypothetical protein